MRKNMLYMMFVLLGLITSTSSFAQTSYTGKVECAAFQGGTNSEVGTLSVKLPEQEIELIKTDGTSISIANDTKICGTTVPKNEKVTKCTAGTNLDSIGLISSLSCNRFDQQPEAGPESAPPSLYFDTQNNQLTGTFSCEFPSSMAKLNYKLKNCKFMNMEQTL